MKNILSALVYLPILGLGAFTFASSNPQQDATSSMESQKTSQSQRNYDADFENRANKACTVKFIHDEFASGGFGESVDHYFMIHNIRKNMFEPTGGAGGPVKFPEPPVPPMPKPQWTNAHWSGSLEDNVTLVRSQDDVWGTISNQYRVDTPGASRRLGADTIYHLEGGSKVTYFRLPENAPAINKQVGVIQALAGKADTLLAVGYERGDLWDSFKSTAKIWRFDGADWQREKIPGIEGHLSKVAIVNSSDIWAAGDRAGLPILLHFDGKLWEEVSSPIDETSTSGELVAEGQAAKQLPNAWDVLVADGVGGILFFGHEQAVGGWISTNYFWGYKPLAYRWDGQYMRPISLPALRNFVGFPTTADNWSKVANSVTSKLWRMNAATMLSTGRILVHMVRQTFGSGSKIQDDGAMLTYDISKDLWNIETFQAPTSYHGFDSLHTVKPGVASMVGYGQLNNWNERGLYIYDCNK